MIGYVTLGSNNLPKAAAFYDDLLGEIGAKRIMESDSFIAWGVSPTAPALSIIKPNDGNPATVGNGVMIAISCDSKEKVDALHKRALELKAVNEGDPGPRAGAPFYIGYFRDLDGNKLNFFCPV